MKKTSRLIAAGVTSLALAGGIGVGIASADPPSPAPSPTASVSPGPSQADPKASKADREKAGRRPLAARALHGEATLAGSQHRVVAFQRGTVDRTSATELSVTSSDGFTARYVVDSSTKIRVNKAEASIAEVKAADRVRIVATKDGSTVTATRIVVRGPR